MIAPTVIPDIHSLGDFVGKPLGTSNWVQVTQQQIDAFAAAPGDHQWIHVDVDRARRESPFGRPIAHGYLTLALAPVLLPQVLRVEKASMAVNYGVDKMRLPAPVPAEARIRLSAEIKNVRQLPTGAVRVTLSLSFELENSPKPACVADVVYVYFPDHGKE